MSQDHCDKSVACYRLQPRVASRAANIFMRRLSIAIATPILIGLSQIARAQQETSSTSGSSSTSSQSTSTSGPSSLGSTTDISAGSSSTSSQGSASTAPSATTGTQAGSGGVGVFSPTPIKIYLNTFAGYDTNVNTNVGPKQGSSYSGGNLVLDYTFGDPRLQVVLNAGAGAVYYIEHVSGQNYDVDLTCALAVYYKSSPRLLLGTTLLFDYLTEPNFDNPGGLNSRNGNYLYTTDNFFASYAWSNRFSTRTSYAFEAYKYDEPSIALFSDRVTNTLGNEFLFQMVPTTKLVAEYRYAIVSYSDEGDIIIPAQFNALGVQIVPPVRLENDSTTHFLLGGIDHTFNPRLTTSLRGGVGIRSYDSGGDQTGPYFEGTVTYAAGRRTSLSWNTRYGLEEPEVSGAQSRTTFRTGVHAKFDLTSRISSTLDAYSLHDDYHSLTGPVAPIPPFTDNSYDIGFALRYAVNPLVAIQAGYHFTDASSDLPGREYTRSRFFGGVTFTF